MKSDSSRVYAPVLRGPLLFHHNNGYGHSGPTYNAAQMRGAQPTTNLYPLQPNSAYRSQYRNTVQAPLRYNPQAYSYYSTMPKVAVPVLVPFSSYSVPTGTYASTVSSKGLSLILIATLMLVALDLAIVRPQKR